MNSAGQYDQKFMSRCFFKIMLVLCCNYDAISWLRVTYFTLMRYEYCRKTLISTLVLLQACVA